MKPDKIHVFRNEGIPDIPTKPAFDSLASRAAVQLASAPWWSHWLSYTGAGVAVITGVVGVIQYQKTKASIPIPPKQELLKTTDLKNKELVPFDTLEVDVLHGDTVIYKGCTRIIVPAGAITDNSDNKIHGKSHLLYREMRNAETIISSGMAMHYFKEGKNIPLESNGLFEIKPLREQRIRPNSHISISFCTNHKNGDNWWFKKDESSNQWTFLGAVVYQKERMIVPQKTVVLNEKEITAADKADQNLPLRPRFKDPNAHSFHLDVSNIPGLEAYRNTAFELLPGQKYFPDELPDEMDQIKVKKTSRRGIYFVSFYNNGTVHQFYVVQVYEDRAEFQKAMTAYEEAMRVYRESHMDVAQTPSKSEMNITEKTLPVSQLVIYHFGTYQAAKPIKKEL